MDQVYDHLRSEVPIDAVSNLINTTITQYKDGKDASLVNGQSDIEDNKSRTERFYNRLKELLQQNPVSGNTEVTKLGNFLFDTQNNMLEVSSEAFAISGSTSLENVIDAIRDYIIKAQAIPAINAIQKYDNEFSMWFKEGFVSSIPKFNGKTLPPKIPKEAFIKNLLNINVGDVKLVSRLDFDSLKDLLRDSTNAFARIEKDEKYFDRYKTLYSVLYKYVDYICNHCTQFCNSIKDLSKDPAYDLKFDRLIKDFMKENQTKMHEFYKTLNDTLEDNDVFPFRRTKYVLDVSKFVFEDKLSILDSKDYEPLFKDYMVNLSDALEELKFTSSNLTEKYFESFKLHSSIEKLTNYLKESDMLGSAGFTILLEAKDIHILDVVEDTTCEEFIDYLKAFSDNTKSFSKNIYNTIKALSKATVDAAGKADAYFKKSYAILEELKKPYEEKEKRLSKLGISVVTFTILDTLQVVSSMHTIWSYDLLMKMYLFELTSRIYEYIYNGISKESQGA